MIRKPGRNSMILLNLHPLIFRQRPVVFSTNDDIANQAISNYVMKNMLFI